MQVVSILCLEHGQLSRTNLIDAEVEVCTEVREAYGISRSTRCNMGVPESVVLANILW